MASTDKSSANERVEVLRAMWAADGSVAQLDDECGPTKTCRNMKDFTFDDMAEPGSDLGTAWRERLRREGKLSGGSVRDLVLGSDER
ncbi:MAG TPA: hypothetical protein VH561_04370 [Micromonosporaceae bacterium]|jgi:hypothetical protein